MKRFMPGLLGLVIYLLTSCMGNNVEVLPPEKMVGVLVNMHVADALGSDYDLRKSSIRFDSTSIYTNFFAENGITKVQLDSSLAYYSRHPEVFMKIYDEVFAILSKKEEESNQLIRKFAAQNMENIYTLEKNIYFSGDSVSYFAPVEIPIDSLGTYFIQVNLRIHLNDSSLNPKIVAYFYKDKADENENDRRYFPKYPVFKSNYNREINLYKELSDTSYHFMKLIVPQTDNTTNYFYKNSQISVLKVYRAKAETP